MSQDRMRHLRAEQRLDDRCSDDGMLGQTAELFGGQAGTTIEALVIEETQSDIVQQRRETNNLDLLRRETNERREALRQDHDLPAVVDQVGIFLKIGLEQ